MYNDKIIQNHDSNTDNHNEPFSVLAHEQRIAYNGGDELLENPKRLPSCAKNACR